MILKTTDLLAQLQGDLAQGAAVLQRRVRMNDDPETLEQIKQQTRALCVTMLRRYAKAEAERLRLAIQWCRDHRPEDEPDDKMAAEFLLYLGDLELTVTWLPPVGSDAHQAAIGDLLLIDEDTYRERIAARGQDGPGFDVSIDRLLGRSRT
jgi:hypothetical protein